MWSLYVRGGHAQKDALAGLVLSANVKVYVRYGTRPPDGGEGPLITLQTVLHYSTGYSSRSMEFFRVQVREKTLLQFKVVL